ncbi:MAG: peptide-N4-asparagine amidase, partial [Rhizomicrobium sp.]
MNIRATLLVGALSALAANAAFAAPFVEAPLTKAPFTKGSGNVAVIEPPVSHPDETPCVVKLYRKAQFGANNVYFVYNPPANCPGPWSTVVLSVDVSLDAGIQYDRSGTIWIGGVPLWFGTTAEPNPNLGPSWHFERDVTDYTSLLEGSNPGFVLIANYTNGQDTSIITSSAKLLFYPVPAGDTPPVVPDEIIPLAADGGGTVALNTGTDTVAIDQTLPTNIAQADLDVFLQGQSNDEFWYTCVPDSLAGELDSCGGGALREGEITVDGAPAGVAPVYPWIFTGGIDPYLWAPIPGVQTLYFKPFRVPLTPFAGVLSNGAIAHQIALSVYGANGYFSVAGALLLYLDHGGTQTTGSITKNTLGGQPSPVVTNTIKTKNGVISGKVDT